MRSDQPTSPMTATTQENTTTIPPVPLALEGSAVLHQMFRVHWANWKALATSAQSEILEEAVQAFQALEADDSEQTGLFSLVGHKGDLMVVHFRRSFDAVNDAELQVSALKLSDFLEPTTSYVSVVELGLYEASIHLYRDLAQQGLQPGTAEWHAAVEKELNQKREAMASRVWPSIPARRYLSFYPMDKKRGEEKNWYQVPIKARQQMMREHGMIGRRYAGQVTQIISGSIGFDDWEWGVDLFADDPLVFKKLVYEMRFDEASAVYGLFGSFYLGLRFPAAELGSLLSGRAPAFQLD